LNPIIKFLFLILIVLNSFSSISMELENNKKEPTPAIPPSFKKIESPIALSIDSIFYNQRMEKKSLEVFENRFIIVHFWASWCMDCHSELIALNRLQRDFRKKALTIVVVSEDFKGINTIDAFFTKHKIDYLDIYVDKKNKIYDSLKLSHLPVSYLIDLNGAVIAESTPGVPVEWDNEDLQKFLEYKVKDIQLLPPEYKTTREAYNPEFEIKEVKPAPKKPKTKTQSKLLIN
jgi:thiol-disulfide isomerase/thioredoxin